VITKKIILPGGMSEQELEIQVESEANQYIPFSLDEVSLDFCVTGPSTSSPGDVEVLIAASRKEKVQDREGLAEAAGLKPMIIDVESYASRLATGRLIEQLPGKGPTIVALFEVGRLTTSMQVLRNDEVLYDRDQAFGGAQLTQLIVRQYGFSPKKPKPRSAAANCQTTTAPACSSLSWKASRRKLRAHAVLLHQHAAQPGGPRHARRRLRIAAGADQRGDPADLVRVLVAQSLRRHGVQFEHPRKEGPARGAFLSDLLRSGHAEVPAVILINLLPHREAARKKRREAFYGTLGGAAVLGLLIAGLGYLWFEAQISAQQSKNGFLQAEIKKLEVEIKEISTLQEEIAALRARQLAVEDLQGDRNLPVHLLNELVRQLPDGVYLTSMKQENQTVTLQGMAQSNERVSELLRNLGNNSPWLVKPELIEITSANVNLSQRDQRRVANFTMRIGLKRPTDAQKAAADKALAAAAQSKG
jgi:type IV pilus assembly protein PilN